MENKIGNSYYDAELDRPFLVIPLDVNRSKPQPGLPIPARPVAKQMVEVVTWDANWKPVITLIEKF